MRRGNETWLNSRYPHLPLMTTALLTLASLSDVVHGHGRMEDPPARNAAWRYGKTRLFSYGKETRLAVGFDVPANYDDVGLDCGGLSVQKTNGRFPASSEMEDRWTSLGGKCGICGDAYTSNRPHESGGKYATNTIVRQYVSGALIDVKILVSERNEKTCPSPLLFTGSYPPIIKVSWKFVCVRLRMTIAKWHKNVWIEMSWPLTASVVSIQWKQDWTWSSFGTSPSASSAKIWTSVDLSSARLPAGLSCSRCVLQWRYHAGNNWGRNAETGASCLGCGLQEEFYKYNAPVSDILFMQSLF